MSLLITRGLGVSGGGAVGEAGLPLQVLTVVDQISSEVEVETALVSVEGVAGTVELDVTVETDEVQVDLEVDEGFTVEGHYGR